MGLSKSNMIVFLVLVLLTSNSIRCFASSANSAGTLKDDCPVSEALKDFNVTKVLGEWHVTFMIRSGDFLGQMNTNVDCMKVNFVQKNVTNIGIGISARKNLVLWKKKISIVSNVSAVVENNTIPARWFVKDVKKRSASVMNIIFLKNNSMVYHICQTEPFSDKNGHYAVMATREPAFGLEQLLTEAGKVLIDHGPRFNRIIPMNQMNCKT